MASYTPFCSDAAKEKIIQGVCLRLSYGCRQAVGCYRIIEDTTLQNIGEVHVEDSLCSFGKSDRRIHTPYKDKETGIRSRLIGLFIAQCFFVLCSGDKARFTIIDKEADEDEGIE